MKAIVKKAEPESVVEDEGKHDSYVSYMADLVGQEIVIKKLKLDDEGNPRKFKNWFMGGIPGGNVWNWHRSWLEFMDA
jgi:hypothetical protein